MVGDSIPEEAVASGHGIDACGTITHGQMQCFGTWAAISVEIIVSIGARSGVGHIVPGVGVASGHGLSCVGRVVNREM